ncbi:response regulator transcription factor [Helcococcus ovis]|uniref:Response regulator transcription factor n=2 Tax=Helcococcus ovis TaxID=72026 RepID=A0A4R9C2R9_9FIRM|nr:response regulator transcription factor [Helcococcus ovis]TFF64187.1 response regulator transcription factor [Helcococcus ovis]TFF66463.1 response regulator transcription factor [Helcococcus ovis]TFF66927.1 response regulator transcription factor [Helcococcus ovis]WNZ01841.1 response regulator transcription factor [Helcococcus ovis]
MKYKILIVEDEPGIARMEKSYLEKNGFYAEIAQDGSEAIDKFYKNNFDLIILDLMIPKLSGEKVLELVRETSKIPVILVTAKVNEDDIIKGLKSGADDYVRKPFSALELVERVKAVLRRTETIHNNEIITTNDGKLKIDITNNRVLKNNEEVALTKNELMIILTLYKNPSKTFTRNEIIEIAFGYEYDAFDRAVDTHIKNIRAKIEDNPRNPIYIKTIYGLGYKAGDTNESR